MLATYIYVMAIRAQWLGWSADDPATTALVSPDLVFPKYLDAYVVNESELDVDLRISAVFDADLERYVVDRLEARRKVPGGDINGTSIRALRVQDYLRTAVRNALRVGQVRERSPMFNMEFELRAEDAPSIRQLGPSSEEALTWVARIYKFAVAVSDPPARAVQEQLGISVPTASVWIRRARDRGILVEPSPLSTAESQERFDLARSVGDYEAWPD